MQNIEAILTELGIEVPADKKENLTKKVAENYITKAEHEKKLGKVETDRDTWKEKAETAETTLKGFEGVDLDTMQKELSDWKKKAEDAEKDAQAKLYERDFADALKTELEGIKFSSEAAKRAIMAEVKDAGLKLKDDFNPRSHKGSDSNFTQNSISVLFHFYQSFPHIIFPHTARFRLLIIFCTFFLVRIAQRFPVCFHFAPKQYPAFYNVCSTDLL